MRPTSRGGDILSNRAWKGSFCGHADIDRVIPRVVRRIYVTGRVQGRSFERARMARRSGRGCGLGTQFQLRSVEAHLEGDNVMVGQLSDRMRKRPHGARIDNVSVGDEAVEHFTTFEVRT